MDKINLKAVLLQNMGEDSADFLPIMGDEKELLNDNMQIPDTLPILPLRNTVLFPGVIIPINIGRDKSLKLIKDSYRQSALIGVVAQKDTNTENPDINDLYQIGTVASILKILEMPDGTTTAIIQGKRRFLLEDSNDFFPHTHTGKSDGQVHGFSFFLKFVFTMRSSSEWNVMIHNLPPGFSIRIISSSEFSSTSSSWFNSIRIA